MKEEKIVFDIYNLTSIIVGAGISEPAEVQSKVSIQNIDAKPQITQKMRRLKLASVNLPISNGVGINFQERFQKASDVVRTLKMHLDLSNAKFLPKNLTQLGFNILDVENIAIYIRTALRLNYQTIDDLEKLSSNPIGNFKKMIEEMIVKNHLRDLLVNKYLSERDSMSELKIFFNTDDSVDFQVNDSSKLVPLEKREELHRELSKYFDLDEYKINYVLQGIQELNFNELVDKLLEALSY